MQSGIKYLFSCIVVAILLVGGTVSAQQKVEFNFHNDNLVFSQDVLEFFRNMRGGDKLTRDFLAIWETRAFTPPEEKLIMEFAQKMLQRKFKSSPEFEDYFRSLIYFKNNQHAPDNFAPWFKSLEKLLPIKTSKALTQYLAFSVELFKNNTINLSVSNRWFLSNNRFVLICDSVPKVIVNLADLTCLSRGSHTTIYGTQGVCFPMTQRWVGQTGTANWARVELDSNLVYAELKKYNINLSTAEYEADSVVFYHKGYFKAPLYGTLIEKLTVNSTPETDYYPKFESYQKSYKINNLFKSINYEGGFSMAGARFRGTGDKEKDAQLYIYSKYGKVAFRASSKAFIIYKDRILSSSTDGALYLGEKDSISHPNADFQFMAGTRKINFTRGNEGTSRAPFYDTYHEVTIEVDVLTWNIDESKVDFSMLASRVPREAYFESNNYYREYKYRKIQGIDDVNPLYILKKLTIDYQSNIVPLSAVAAAYKKEQQDVAGQMRELVAQGFILFDEEDGLITVRSKTINYVKNNAGKLDYDIIRFFSLTEKNDNASLNLDDNNLDIKGVNQLSLSDSQSVFITPLNRKVTLKQNRNVEFEGQVRVGILDFYGSGFFYDYNTNKINLQHVDSLRLRVLGKSDGDQRKLIEVKSVIEDINGEVAIDDKDNKSGLKPFPEYPIFESQKISYVYYDRKNSQGKVYDRKRFYFAIDPFILDSLNELSSVSSLYFKGNLYSGDIFPIFSDVLIVQPDTSLGFIRQTPSEGFPTYKDKGMFYNTINLSLRGLYGKGKLDYQSSITYADKFLFMLDSMNAYINSFVISKTSKTTDASVNNAYTHWVPYNDTMFVYSRKTSIMMYNNVSAHTGRIAYTPYDLSGNGISKFGVADVSSKYFRFRSDNLLADTSDVHLTSFKSDRLAVSSTNMNTNVSFANRQGVFGANDPNSLTEFPVNQYKSSLNEYTWDFDKNSVDFFPVNNAAKPNYFLSMHPKQDSLVFGTTSAHYDLSTSNIDVQGVKSILVADAQIFPDKDYVQIQPEAVIKPLENARLIASVDNNYHTIYNAILNIQGRKKYSGEGSYDYVNISKKPQLVLFNKIFVDTSMQTVALGNLSVSLDFKLNPKILYYGDMRLEARKKYLQCDGYAYPVLEPPSGKLRADYFRFKGPANPDTLLIAINDPKTAAGQQLYSGFQIDNFIFDSYPTAMSKKKDPGDHDIFDAKGYMIYDPKAKEFRISDSIKVFDPSLRGAYYSFNDTSENVYCEGEFNLGVDLEGLDLKMVGNGKTNLVEDKLRMNVFLTADFKFLKKATAIMVNNLRAFAKEAEVVNPEDPSFMKIMSEFLNDKQMKKLREDVLLYGNYDLENEIEHSFTLTNVKMEWDATTRSFKSTGDKIGLQSIGDKVFNKQLKGYVQVVRKRGNDVFNLYFEADPNNWFFFSYRKGVMESISSDEAYNEIITKKSKDNSPFGISAVKRKVDFVRLFQ